MQIWWLLGFYPALIVGLIVFVYIHLRKGEQFYYNHDLDETILLSYIDYFRRPSEYSTIDSRFQQELECQKYLAVFLRILAIMIGIVITLCLIVVAAGIIGWFGPILYIPIVVMCMTLRKLKKEKNN